MADSRLGASTSSAISSYTTRAHGIIVKYFMTLMPALYKNPVQYTYVTSNQSSIGSVKNGCLNGNFQAVGSSSAWF